MSPISSGLSTLSIYYGNCNIIVYLPDFPWHLQTTICINLWYAHSQNPVFFFFNQNMSWQHQHHCKCCTLSQMRTHLPLAPHSPWCHIQWLSKQCFSKTNVGWWALTSTIYFECLAFLLEILIDIVLEWFGSANPSWNYEIFTHGTLLVIFFQNHYNLWWKFQPPRHSTKCLEKFLWFLLNVNISIFIGQLKKLSLWKYEN